MRHLEQLISAAAIPGVALAVVERGQVNVINMGVRERGAVPQIGEATIFDAASLSKPVVAYIALQLVDAGILDLDEPLSKIVRDGISSNLASSAITARHVLTHTSGLPNLRGAEPLRTYFSPGSWFSYSSVGFNYLQKALEVGTNETLEALAERLVFAPLGMHSSSFQWREHFSEDLPCRTTTNEWWRSIVRPPLPLPIRFRQRRETMGSSSLQSLRAHRWQGRRSVNG